MQGEGTLDEKRAEVFEKARHDFRVALAHEDLSHGDVCDRLDIPASTLSTRLRRDEVAAWEPLAAMPELAPVVADLLAALAEMYRGIAPLRQITDPLEKLEKLNEKLGGLLAEFGKESPTQG